MMISLIREMSCSMSCSMLDDPNAMSDVLNAMTRLKAVAAASILLSATAIMRGLHPSFAMAYYAPYNTALLTVAHVNRLSRAAQEPRTGQIPLSLFVLSGIEHIHPSSTWS